MSSTTARQKISLIIFAFFLTFLILEIGLRLGGWLFTLKQESRNQVYFEDNEYRILCLGESTTALGGENSYPAQLELILSQHRPDIRFRVINKGAVNKTTEHFTAQLDKNIQRYKPDLVVTMMGINDDPKIQFNMLPLRIHSFLKQSRTYNLFNLLTAHIINKIKERQGKVSGPQIMKENEEFLQEEVYDINNIQAVLGYLKVLEEKAAVLEKLLMKQISPEQRTRLEQQLHQIQKSKSWPLIKAGRYFRMREQFQKAQEFFKMAVISNPQNYGAYLELGRCFREQKYYLKALSVYQEAFNLNPREVFVLLEMGRCYNALKQFEKTDALYKKIFEREPKTVWIYSEIALWFKEYGNFGLAEQIFIKGIEKNPRNYHLYEQLGELYAAKGEQDKAEDFLSKAEEGRSLAHNYPPVSVRNYNKIVETLKEKRIKHICMQYPLRSMDTLKQMIWSNENLIIVENKRNFDQALKNSEYTKYFSDHFAGDFGHCTPVGNRLIAENIAKAILGIVERDRGHSL